MFADDAPRAVSVPEQLSRTAEGRAQEIAVDHRGRRRSSARLLEDIARLAQGLVDLGVRPGQRVALVCALHTESVVALHAILRIGAVAVPHDPESTSRELRRAFEDCSPVLAIADSTALATIREIPSDVHPKAVVAVEPTRRARDMVRVAVHGAAQTSVRREAQARLRGAARIVRRRPLLQSRSRPRPEDRTIAWSALMASCPLDADHPCPGSQDLALLQSTTGPHGELLGAMLTHENLLESARRLAGAWDQDASEPGPVVASLPLHEFSGLLVAALAPLLDGRALVMAPRSADLLPAVRRARPAVVCAPSAVLLAAALSAPSGADDLAQVPSILTVLDGAVPSVVQRLERLTGHAVLVIDARAEHGVSLTGTVPIERLHPLCRPLPGTRTDLVGEELRIAGPQVFHGYWNHPDETADVLSGDGWVRTEMRVSASEGEAFELSTRSRARIVAPDGRVVPAREVVTALLGHPDVSHAEVQGDELPDGGHQVRARVILRAGSTSTAEDLRRFVAARLSPVKVPGRIDLVPSPSVLAPDDDGVSSRP